MECYDCKTPIKSNDVFFKCIFCGTKYERLSTKYIQIDLDMVPRITYKVTRPVIEIRVLS